MGDQRNQMIKGSPSQYVKLNIGGDKNENSKKVFRVEIFNFLCSTRISLLHDDTNTDKGRLYAQSNVLWKARGSD